MWVWMVTFEFRDDDQTADTILDWLEENTRSFRVNFHTIDDAVLMIVLLDEESTNDAVFLALWSGCTSISRYNQLSD